MSERHRLPNRRRSENLSFHLNGHYFTATIGFYRDGRIGEAFLTNSKHGNQLDTNSRDAAILLSFALQHGADINQIRKALCRDAQGRAVGPIGALLDLLAEGERHAEEKT
jgi:hypothetical protein